MLNDLHDFLLRRGTQFTEAEFTADHDWIVRNLAKEMYTTAFNVDVATSSLADRSGSGEGGGRHAQSDGAFGERQEDHRAAHALAAGRARRGRTTVAPAVQGSPAEANE